MQVLSLQSSRCTRRSATVACVQRYVRIFAVGTSVSTDETNGARTRRINLDGGVICAGTHWKRRRRCMYMGQSVPPCSVRLFSHMSKHLDERRCAFH